MSKPYILPLKKKFIPPDSSSPYVCSCGRDCLETQVNWKVEQLFPREKIELLVIEHIKNFGISRRSK